MGNLKYLLIFVLLYSTQITAQVNNDAKTTQAVIENSLAQQGIENLHNHEVRQVASKKKSIAKMTAKMATIQELYRISMQNIDGFGQESKMYAAIATNAIEIFTKIPVATRELLKRPYSAISCSKDIANLTLEAQSLINTFVNIVNNGKVSIKIKDLRLEGADDGYNFLNRTDRYLLANQVLTHLVQINYKLEAIIYLSRFCNGIGDLVYALDPEIWYSYLQGKSQINTIIQLYEGL